MLKWIIQRLSGDAKATRTPIGDLPGAGPLDLDGLDISWADLDLLLTVDTRGMEAGGGAHPGVLPTFDSHLPARLLELHQELLDGSARRHRARHN